MIATIAACIAMQQATFVASLPLTPLNGYYIGNKDPLQPSPLLKLPIGAIKPQGWLLTQLQSEADGFIGHLTEISGFLKKEGNGWLSKTGEGDHGWEEVPYWLKGFGDLGYVLGDKRITDEAKIWIEGALNSQQADGYFGPKMNRSSLGGKPDMWPQMIMLFCLQSYFEYSGDKRVIDLMTRYFKWQATVPENDFLVPYWQNQRGGDNLVSVLWLYNRTGEPWLLDLARKIHRRTADWTSGIPDWHGVNFAQAFREPTSYWALSNDPIHLNGADRNYTKMRELYGQVPGGLYGADENARVGFSDPRQAAETCAMVEMMLSCELLLATTGDGTWADRCEDVAFNSLPASMTADEKALHYLTSPNMPLADKQSKSPGLQNGGPMLLFDPHDHRCCQHNVSHGWPYFAESLWMATPGNGLAAVFYAPCVVTAKVGEAAKVTIEQTTSYPFDQNINLLVKLDRSDKFPLYLRVPDWCSEPTVSVNGTDLPVQSKGGGYIKIDRQWTDGDKVHLQLPMPVRTKSWAKNQDAISVSRGPLTFSLKIGEQLIRMGGTDKWPAWEIHPTTDWNYGLLPNTTFEVVEKLDKAQGQPFVWDSSPIEIVTKGRKIPEWQLDRLGLIGKLQASPALSAEQDETITLIPMGAARLRISAFPTVSNAQSATKWVLAPKPAKALRTRASFCFGNDTVDALTDKLEPSSSGDDSIPRLTWWDHKGSNEWVEIDLPNSQKLTNVNVYWFDDGRTGGGCRVPETWRLQLKVNGEWQAVTPRNGNWPVSLDAYSTASFQARTATSIRIEAKLQKGFSGGILEVKFG